MGHSGNNNQSNVIDCPRTPLQQAVNTLVTHFTNLYKYVGNSVVFYALLLRTVSMHVKHSMHNFCPIKILNDFNYQ